MEKEQQGNPFQPYHAQELFDQSGMTTVYRALGPANEPAVIKLLQVSPRLASSSDYSQRVRAILAFSHPAAVPILQQGETETETFFIQPWMAGGSLQDRLDRGQPLVTDILPVMRSIIPALESAHRQGIIHQWIRPSKILFDDQDQAYLADSGFADLFRLADPSFPRDPQYTSPELASPEHRATPAADVFSLATILWQMVTGNESDFRDRGFPDTLQAVIERNLNPNPADRYRTPTDLLIALEQAFQDLPPQNNPDFFPPPPEFTPFRYSLEITHASLPESMTTGSLAPFSLTMVNRGGQVLSLPGPLNLHLIWTDASGKQVLTQEADLRIEGGLDQGSSYNWELQEMRTPDTPGRYALLLQITAHGEPGVLASYQIDANVEPPVSQQNTPESNFEPTHPVQRDLNDRRRQQAGDLRSRIQSLEQAYRQDEGLLDAFRRGIDNSLSIAQVSLQNGDLSSADTFLSVAEQEYESWQNQPEAWRLVFSNLSDFLNQIDEANPGYAQALAYLTALSERGPTFETPERFSEQLNQAQDHVNRYLVLRERFQNVEAHTFSDTPELSDLREKIRNLSLEENSQALEELEDSLEKLITQLSNQAPMTKEMDPATQPASQTSAAQTPVQDNQQAAMRPVETQPAWEQEIESQYWKLNQRLNEMRDVPAWLNADTHRLLEAVIDKVDNGDEEKARHALNLAANVIENWATQPEAWRDANQTMEDLRREVEDFPEAARRSVRSSLTANYNRLLGSGSPGDLKAYLEETGQQVGLYQTAIDELETLEAEVQAGDERQALARLRPSLESIRPRDTGKIYAFLEQLEPLRMALSTRASQDQQAVQPAITAPAEPAAASQGSNISQEIVLPPAQATSTSAGNGHPPQPFQPTPTILSSISVVYTPPEPPKKEHSLRLTVRANKVDLEYQSKLYSSQNLLQEQELLYAEYEGPQTYGETLFRGLIHDLPPTGSPEPPTSIGYAVALDKSKGRLRMELRVDDFPTACRWEYLKDPASQLPFSVREQAPFYRLYSTYQADLVPADPLRVLVVLANPSDLGQAVRSDGKPVLPVIQGLVPLQKELELEVIKGSTRTLVESGLAEVEILPAPASLDAIKEKLQEKTYHVLHIIAHGIFIQSQQKYYLVFENGPQPAEGAGPPGSSALVPATAFDQTLWDCGVRLVVLSACQSGNLGLGSSVLPAIAPELMQNRLSAVIAMQGDLPFKAAQLFHARFYDDLARTGRIDMALAATRYDLFRLDRDGWSWGLPLLLMSASDGKLFEVNEARASHLHRPELEELDLADIPAEVSPQLPAVANALNQQLQRFGLPADPRLIQSLLSGPSRPPEREAALAARQDRSRLNHLTARVTLKARSLQEYVRSHSGLELDERTFDQIASTLNAGKHLILIGPPGTGKTSLCQDICSYASELNVTTGVALTTATSDWTTFDTVGGYVPTRSGTLQFRPGIFLEAIRTGQWLVIDEINRAEIDKAFGELFTVLSGQQVDLPWEVEGEAVRVLPPLPEKARSPLDPGSWALPGPPGYSYTIHPNWRIIGTMNVYDKSSLYQMSFAFMRRFAFVDVDLPADDTYFGLIDRWLTRQKLKDGEQGELVTPGPEFEQTLRKMLQRKDGQNPLMQRRALGPAIVKDMIEYAADRYHQALETGALANPQVLLIEAFLLYVVSQLDGLDYEGIRQVYTYLYGLFHELDAEECERVLNRIRLLYPHIPINEWEVG